MLSAALCLIVKDEEPYFKSFIEALNGMVAGADALKFSDAYSCVVIGLTRPQSKLADLWRSAAAMEHLDVPIYTVDIEWEDHFAKARQQVQELASEHADIAVWVDFDDVPTSSFIGWVLHIRDVVKENPTLDLVHLSAPYLYAKDPMTGAKQIEQIKERAVYPASAYQWVGAVHELMVPKSQNGAEKRIGSMVSAFGIEHSPEIEVRVPDRNWKIMEKHWLPNLMTHGAEATPLRHLYYMLIECARSAQGSMVKALRTAILKKAGPIMELMKKEELLPAKDWTWDRMDAWYISSALRSASDCFLHPGSSDEVLLEEYKMLRDWAMPFDVLSWGGALNELAWNMRKTGMYLQGKGLLAPDELFPGILETAPDGMPQTVNVYYEGFHHAVKAREAIIVNDVRTALNAHIQALAAGRFDTFDWETEKLIHIGLWDSKLQPVPCIKGFELAALTVPTKPLGVPLSEWSPLFTDFVVPGSYATTPKPYNDDFNELSTEQIIGSGLLNQLAQSSAVNLLPEDKSPYRGLYVLGAEVWDCLLAGQETDAGNRPDDLLCEWDGGSEEQDMPNAFGPPVPGCAPRDMLAGKSISFITLTALETWSGRTIRTRGIGGSESCIVYLAEAMVEAGASEVTVYSPLHRAETYNGVKYLPLDRWGISPPVDLVIASRTPEPLADRHGKKQILWLHDMPQQGQSYVIPNCDEIIAPSEYLARLIQPAASVPVRVIPHGISRMLLQLAEPADFQHPADPDNLGIIFGSQPERGMGGFAELMRHETSFTKHPVALYGTYNWFAGGGMQDYNRWKVMRSWQYDAQTSGVMCTGRVPHWMAGLAYHLSDACIYPSTGFKETFGLAPIESYICGAKLLIGENCGATVELLQSADLADVKVMPPYTSRRLGDWQKELEGLTSRPKFGNYADCVRRMSQIGLRIWNDPEYLRQWIE